MLVTLITAVFSVSQPALYAIVDQPDIAGAPRLQRVVRLSWADRGDLRVDTVAELPARFLGLSHKHHIVGDWLVTCNAGVIDLTTGGVIHEESDGEVLGITKKQVFFRLNNVNRPRGVFVFDGDSRSILPVPENSAWNLPGTISANRLNSATSTLVGQIWLHEPGNAARLLSNKCTAQLSPFSSSLPLPPVIWLNDDMLLTQERNGVLITLDLQGNSTSVLTLSDLPDTIFPPSFTRDPLGRLIYRCGSQAYQIDVAQRTATPLKWVALGHGFEISHESDTDGLRTIQYEGRRIARRKCHPVWARTTAHLFAIVEETDPNVEPKQRTIWVWNARTRSSRILDLPVRCLVSE